jgi:hypothetical protein
MSLLPWVCGDMGSVDDNLKRGTLTPLSARQNPFTTALHDCCTALRLLLADETIFGCVPRPSISSIPRRRWHGPDAVLVSPITSGQPRHSDALHYVDTTVTTINNNNSNPIPMSNISYREEE